MKRRVWEEKKIDKDDHLIN
jgi:hypothetical protein